MAVDSKEDLSALTVVVLRKKLKKRGLSQTGQKSNLVDRLWKAIQEEKSKQAKTTTTPPEKKKEPTKANNSAKNDTAPKQTQLQRAARLGLPVKQKSPEAKELEENPLATGSTSVVESISLQKRKELRAERFQTAEYKQILRKKRFGEEAYLTPQEIAVKKREERFGPVDKDNTKKRKREANDLLAAKRQRIQRFGAVVDPLDPLVVELRAERFGITPNPPQKKSPAAKTGNRSANKKSPGKQRKRKNLSHTR